MHVYHPKVVHTDHHSSIKFLHSRHDPNVGLINGGYPQPLLNLNPSSEYRINEEDFFKWRREQQRRAQEKRRHLQQQHKQNKKSHDYDEYEDNGAAEDDSEDDQPNYDEELYKKHKANKSSSSGYRKESKHKNHSYSDHDDYDSSNSDKAYSRGKPDKKQRRPSSRLSVEEDNAKKYRIYGVSNVDAESSNIEPQFLSHDPTAIDPGYYSTLPKNPLNVPPSNQDDIYSGLLAKKYNKEITGKSKLLADINYSRKQQTKNLTQRKGQE